MLQPQRPRIVGNAGMRHEDRRLLQVSTALGIEQINQGIMQVSQVVQTNAATSEESAAASQNLTSQAAQLKKLVGLFKLEKTKIKLDDDDPGDAQLPLAEPEGNTMRDNADAARVSIALSDSEFGKY